MRIEYLCMSVLRVPTGPRVKLAGRKSALYPTVVYSTDRSNTVVPVIVLLFVALWFFLRLALRYFVTVVFLLALRLPRLGKRES